MWPPVLTLLLSGLTDAVDVRIRQARLQELRNRLGIQKRPYVGLEARMAWIFEQYRDEPWVHDLIYALFHILEIDDGGEGVFIRSQSEAPEGWPGGEASYSIIPFPSRSYFPRLEPYLPWITLQMAHRMRAVDHSKEVPAGSEEWALELYYFYGEGHQINRLVDWAEATEPDLMNLTWAQAMEAQEAWHQQLAAHVQAGADGILRGSRPTSPGMTIASWADGSRVDRLVTKNQVRREGESMGHCLGSYWKDVQKGTSLLLSYRDAANIPYVSVELVPRSLTFVSGSDEFWVLHQLEGPGNRQPWSVAANRMEAVLRNLGVMPQRPWPVFVPDVVMEELEEEVRVQLARLHQLIEKSAAVFSGQKVKNEIDALLKFILSPGVIEWAHYSDDRRHITLSWLGQSTREYPPFQYLRVVKIKDGLRTFGEIGASIIWVHGQEHLRFTALTERDRGRQISPWLALVDSKDDLRELGSQIDLGIGDTPPGWAVSESPLDALMGVGLVLPENRRDDYRAQQEAAMVPFQPAWQMDAEEALRPQDKLTPEQLRPEPR